MQHGYLAKGHQFHSYVMRSLWRLGKDQRRGAAPRNGKCCRIDTLKRRIGGRGEVRELWSWWSLRSEGRT